MLPTRWVAPSIGVSSFGSETSEQEIAEPYSDTASNILTRSLSGLLVAFLDGCYSKVSEHTKEYCESHEFDAKRVPHR